MWTATAPTGPAEVCGRIETPEVVTPMGDIGPPRIRHLGPLHIRGTPCSKSYFRPWAFPPCFRSDCRFNAFTHHLSYFYPQYSYPFSWPYQNRAGERTLQYQICYFRHNVFQCRMKLFGRHSKNLKEIQTSKFLTFPKYFVGDARMNKK